jgi:magnesium chelatase family protein
MLSRIFSAAVLGLDGEIIEVEVDVSGGLPKIVIVGLPDAAVQESKVRVRAAIRNSGMSIWRKCFVVNLAPAAVRKAGPAFDLPIAIGLMTRMGLIPPASLEGALIVGELSMDGSVRHIRGALSMAAAARQAGFERVFVPAADAAEAALIPDLQVFGIDQLIELRDHLSGQQPLTEVNRSLDLPRAPRPVSTDFQEARGQEHVKRAMEIAAAGGHNALLVGPPGAGKTLISRALPSILPELSIDESLEVTRIYSVADQLPHGVPLVQHRPFRAPHHTISHAGLVGGGNWPQPGEISLAHHGVLFLDELPEFASKVLEVMRQPMEDKQVTISRAQGSLTFPANFQLIAAMNPCPCGYYGDLGQSCTCSERSVTRYQQRLSGPLLDRIDLHIEVPRVDFEKLSEGRQGESSAQIQARVQRARDVQLERFKGEIGSNAGMGPGDVHTHCALEPADRQLMRQAMQQMDLSARGYHRVLKLARTIADLHESQEIETAHLAEALQYRPKITAVMTRR